MYIFKNDNNIYNQDKCSIFNEKNLKSFDLKIIPF